MKVCITGVGPDAGKNELAGALASALNVSTLDSVDLDLISRLRAHLKLHASIPAKEVLASLQVVRKDTYLEFLRTSVNDRALAENKLESFVVPGGYGDILLPGLPQLWVPENVQGLGDVVAKGQELTRRNYDLVFLLTPEVIPIELVLADMALRGFYAAAGVDLIEVSTSLLLVDQRAACWDRCRNGPYRRRG